MASDVAFSMSSTVSLESVCVGTPAAFMLIGHTPPHQAEAVAHLDSVFGPAAALPAVPRRASQSNRRFIAESRENHRRSTAKSNACLL